MPPTNPSLSAAERLDALCDKFETDWRAGRRPRTDDYLVAVPAADREVARAALVAIEAELLAGRAAGDTSVTRSSVRTGSHHGPGPSTLHSAADERQPETIGRFEVRSVLGSGAFGRVYRAFDPHLGREVAIKVPLSAALRTDVERDRFLKEARAAGTVSHPNICQIHEVGEHDGRPYIVMALVPGQSLAETIRTRKEPLPERQAAIIVRKLSLALDAAHKKGVVHRDLKPANVMFDRERKDLVVMDFGLARGPVLGDARDTQSGVIMGTPAYMSPEQARGDSKAVGPTGDIYSLGVILYELLTGSRPFSGTAAEVIGQILHVEPEPPSKRRPGTDPRLEDVCSRAMAKDPTARFGSMRELAAALDTYLRAPANPVAETTRPTETRAEREDGVSTDTRKLADVFAALSEERKVARAETAQAVEAAVAKHRTPRWIFVVLGLLLVGGLTAIAGILFFAKTDTAKVTIELTGIDVSDKSLSYTLDGKPIAADELSKPIELKVGEHELVVSKGKTVVKRFLFTVSGGRNPRIEYREIDPPAPPAEPKKKDPPVEPKKKDPPDPKPPELPSPGPSDGFKGLELVATLPHKMIVSDAIFSPDGTRLLTSCFNGEPADQRGVHMWDTKTWKPVGTPAVVNNVGRLAHQHGKLVFGEFGNGGLGDFSRAQMHVWNADKWAPDTKFFFDGQNPGRFNSLEVLPDGKRVLASRYDTYEREKRDTAIFDLDTGEFKLKVNGYASAYVPDKEGKTILVGDGAELKQIEIATSKVTRTLKSHTRNIACVACSPDGRFAASSSDGPANEIVLWDLAAPDGSPVLLGNQKAYAYCLGFSPNGKSLLSGSAEGVLKLWDVVERKEVAAARADPVWVWSARFSPDGTHAVTGCQEAKAAKVWKLTKAVSAPVPKVPVDPRPPEVPVVVLPPIGPSEGLKGLTPLHSLPHKVAVEDAMFSPDGSVIYTASYAGNPGPTAGVIPWDTKTGKQKGAPAPLINVGKVAFGGGKFVFAVNGNGGLGEHTPCEIVVWAPGKAASELTFPFAGKTPGRFMTLELARDGKTLLASRYQGDDQATTIFDLATGETKFKANGFVSCFVPEPGKNATTVLMSEKNELKQVEVASGKVLRTLKKHTDSIQCVACSSDGRLAATSSGPKVNELILWDLAALDGNPVVLATEKVYVRCLAFSPKGRTLLTGSDEGVVKVWDVVEQKEAFAARGDRTRIAAVGFSPDGTLAVTAGWGDGAKVWKLTR